jgi:hypothetical protein
VCIFIQPACKLLILRESVFRDIGCFSRISIRGFLFRLIKQRFAEICDRSSSAGKTGPLDEHGKFVAGVGPAESPLKCGKMYFVKINNLTSQCINIQPSNAQSDTPAKAGGLMSWAASKAVGPWV